MRQRRFYKQKIPIQLKGVGKDHKRFKCSADDRTKMVNGIKMVSPPHKEHTHPRVYSDESVEIVPTNAGNSPVFVICVSASKNVTYKFIYYVVHACTKQNLGNTGNFRLCDWSSTQNQGYVHLLDRIMLSRIHIHIKHPYWFKGSFVNLYRFRVNFRFSQIYFKKSA